VRSGMINALATDTTTYVNDMTECPTVGRPRLQRPDSRPARKAANSSSAMGTRWPGSG
jgi:hypothetical protein